MTFRLKFLAALSKVFSFCSGTSFQYLIKFNILASLGPQVVATKKTYKLIKILNPLKIN